MDYLIKYVLEYTGNKISEQYILPLLLLAFVFSNIVGLLVEKYSSEKTTITITKKTVDNIVFICFIISFFIWDFKLLRFIFFVHIAGVSFFELFFSIYKSIETYGKPFVFFRNGIILGFPFKKQITHKIKIDGGNLIWKIPEENKKQGGEWGEELTTDEYASKGYRMPDEKTVFTQMWVFYNRTDLTDRGRVILNVSVQKMAEYASLEHIENLNLAASHYRFSNFDTISDNDERLRNVKENLLSKKWSAKNINGKPVISYWINYGWGRSYKLMHIAINKNKMLTVRLHCIANALCIEKLCDEFAEKILNNWELFPEKDDLSMNLSEDRYKGISQHIFEPFSYRVPDIDKFKIILRNHSENKIEWCIFERSDLFYDWFNQQYECLEKEYMRKSREYIEQSILSLQQKVSAEKEAL